MKFIVDGMQNMRRVVSPVSSYHTHSSMMRLLIGCGNEWALVRSTTNILI